LTFVNRPFDQANVRRRFLARAIERANVALSADDGEPIEHVTPHSLRRTFISLLLAAGADVPYVMAQAGHDNPKTTLAIYARVIATRTDHGAALDELIGHRIGTNAPASPNEADPPKPKPPANDGSG
jgi:integrase